MKKRGTVFSIVVFKKSMDKVNILIIDDDKYMNETLCEIFTSEGYNVEHSMMVLDSINKIKYNEKEYQLLILDYNLKQDITGLEIYNIAKEKNPKIKAIMISGYGDKRIKKKALDAGINIFLDKPFIINDLINVVNNEIFREFINKDGNKNKNNLISYY